MILLVASHSDLLLMDPKFIAERHQGERFLIVVQKKDYEKNKASMLSSNIEFVTVSNIENKVENLDIFIKEVRKAIGNNKPRLVYVCSCTRLHCIILYIIYGRKAWFIYFQGSGYMSRGSMDDVSIKALPYIYFLPMNLKRYLIHKLGRIAYRIRIKIKIIGSIKAILFNATASRYIDLRIALNLFKHSGIRPNELCAHNENGLKGMRKDYSGKDIKSSFLINHKSANCTTKCSKNIFSGIEEIIIAPSILFDRRLTNKEFELAVMGWKRVIKLLKMYGSDQKINFRPHPRQVLSKARNNLVMNQLLINCDMSISLYKETLELIDAKNLIITDVSGLLNQCDLYNQATISVQDQCLTGGFDFLWLLPEKTTESCLLFDTIESLQAFILK